MGVGAGARSGWAPRSSHSLGNRCGGRGPRARAAHPLARAHKHTPAQRVPRSAPLQKFLLGIRLSSPWTLERFGVEKAKRRSTRGSENTTVCSWKRAAGAAFSPPRPEPRPTPPLSRAASARRRPGRLGVWLLSRGVFAGREARVVSSAMQNYKYDKAIAPESKNGGSPALNNNPRKGGSKRVLLICLDLFCLFMGEPSPAAPRPLGAPRASQAGPVLARGARRFLAGPRPRLLQRRPALSAPEAPAAVSGAPRRAWPRAPALPDPTGSPACAWVLRRV